MTDEIVDLAAYREAKKKALEIEAEGERTISVQLRHEPGRVILDLPELDHVLSWTPEKAREFGREMMIYASGVAAAERYHSPERIAAREADRRRREELARVKLVGKDGKPLPPLKVRGWAIETLGGSPTSEDTRWFRMTSSRNTRLAAEQLRKSYEEYGYAPDRIRVVPVDHRGRVIPPERMPPEAVLGS